MLAVAQKLVWVVKANSAEEILRPLESLNHKEAADNYFSMNYVYPSLELRPANIPCMWLCMEAPAQQHESSTIEILQARCEKLEE